MKGHVKTVYTNHSIHILHCACVVIAILKGAAANAKLEMQSNATATNPISDF